VHKDSVLNRVRTILASKAQWVLWVTLIVPALSVLLTATALAASPLSPQDTQRSEELGEAGVAAYQAANYEQAKTQLEEGYRLSAWGTIGVWLGKTYDKLGLTSDAYRVYVEVASSGAVVGEAEPFIQARVQAQQSADAIVATSAIVELKSASAKSALVVNVDGQVVSLTAQNTLAVAPGEHTFEVTWDNGKLPPQALTLVAGQAQVIELDVVKTRQAPSPPTATTPLTQYLNFTLAGAVLGGPLGPSIV
jgi:hypothetical protein